MDDGPLPSFVAALLAGLLFAAVVRWIYVAIRNRRDDRERRVVSWWLVPLVLLFAVAAVVGQRDAEIDDRSKRAEAQGVVADASDATSVDRCIAGNLDVYDFQPAKRPAGLARGTFEVYARRVCEAAERDGSLLETGEMYPEDVKRIGEEVAAKMRADGELP